MRVDPKTSSRRRSYFFCLRLPLPLRLTRYAGTIRFAAMSIRFQCAACQQPIEVDDEWAAKIVTCPYCRKTVIAAPETTLVSSPEVRVASAVSPGDEPSPPPRVPVAPAIPGETNRVAGVALFLACAMLVFLATAIVVADSHSLELNDLAERLLATTDSRTRFDVMIEYMDAHGGAIPGWLLLLSFLQFMAGVSCLAGLGCAIVAVRRPQRRAIAMSALIISGGMFFLYCTQLIF